MATSSGYASSTASKTVFRVRRKRTADPHEALVVSLKRPRHMCGPAPFAPLIYQLTTTSNQPDLSTVESMPPASELIIIDYDPSRKSQGSNNNGTYMETDPSPDDEGNPLEALNDAVGEGAEPVERNERDNNGEQITLNGVPLQVVPNGETGEEYVFDFYWNARGIEYDVDQFEVRPALPEDFDLYSGEETESSAAGDDEDEDSNAEDFWKNDYPDEEGDNDSETSSDASVGYDLPHHFDEFEVYGSDNDNEE